MYVMPKIFGVDFKSVWNNSVQLKLWHVHGMDPDSSVALWSKLTIFMCFVPTCSPIQQVRM